MGEDQIIYVHLNPNAIRSGSTLLDAVLETKRHDSNGEFDLFSADRPEVRDAD